MQDAPGEPAARMLATPPPGTDGDENVDGLAERRALRTATLLVGLMGAGKSCIGKRLAHRKS